jgi:hypothetical protein
MNKSWLYEINYPWQVVKFSFLMSLFSSLLISILPIMLMNKNQSWLYMLAIQSIGFSIYLLIGFVIYLIVFLVGFKFVKQIIIKDNILYNNILLFGSMWLFFIFNYYCLNRWFNLENINVLIMWIILIIATLYWGVLSFKFKKEIFKFKYDNDDKNYWTKLIEKKKFFN